MTRSSTSRAAVQEHKLHWPHHIGSCFVSISCVFVTVSELRVDRGLCDMKWSSSLTQSFKCHL